jgi:hypothetical protein
VPVAVALAAQLRGTVVLLTLGPLSAPLPSECPHDYANFWKILNINRHGFAQLDRRPRRSDYFLVLPATGQKSLVSRVYRRLVAQDVDRFDPRAFVVVDLWRDESRLGHHLRERGWRNPVADRTGVQAPRYSLQQSKKKASPTKQPSDRHSLHHTGVDEIV